MDERNTWIMLKMAVNHRVNANASVSDEILNPMAFKMDAENFR